jgi:vacuolar iron transporter family protein
MKAAPIEAHRSGRGGWLRAGLLGSNDAIVSTASLMLGVSASEASRGQVLVAGVAGLVAGALSMGAGEYVSVSSQRDAERADLEREKAELAADPESELAELTQIYVKRGLDPTLARAVAVQLTAHDQLGAHAHDELNLDPHALARPFQAAWISTLSFSVFAMVPILALLVSPPSLRLLFIGAISLASLAVTGALGGWLGGAPLLRASARVAIGGALAMGFTTAVGRLFGVVTG